MGWGRLLSAERRPEKVPFIHSLQKPIDWKCLVVMPRVIKRERLGGGQGGYGGGRGSWGGRNGFQQVDSKENRKLGT